MGENLFNSQVQQVFEHTLHIRTQQIKPMIYNKINNTIPGKNIPNNSNTEEDLIHHLLLDTNHIWWAFSMVILKTIFSYLTTF